MMHKNGLEFVENKGQIVDDKGNAHSEIKFTASSNNTRLFLAPERISYVFSKYDGKAFKPGEVFSKKDMGGKASYYRMDMEFVGANKNVNINSSNLLPGVSNYFTASAGKDGIAGVQSFGKVVYENVYPNIDMILVSKGKGMKAEFIVRPGGDPSAIKMRFNGADNVALGTDGGYTVKTPMGTMSEDAPYSYVKVDGKESEVAVTFSVDGNTVGFNVPAYDKTQTLVIDPNRDWGTLHGGDAEDQATAVAVSRAYAPTGGTRYIYITGYTSGGTFPTVSASQAAYGGAPFDAFVAAYNYDGTRAWSTYLGGNGDDRAFGIDVDGSSAGTGTAPTNVYVVGQTTSGSGGGAPWGGFWNNTRPSPADIDAFVIRLTASDGTPNAGRVIGGTLDDYLNSVTVDVSGNVTAAGYTASPGIATGAGVVAPYNALGSAAYSGMIVRLPADLSATTWLSYYGNVTSSQTIFTSVAFTNSTGEVWAGGYTSCSATGNTIATPGSFSTVLNNNGSGSQQLNGNVDGFVVRFNNSGARIAATYYGQTGQDYIFSVANDAVNDQVIVAGKTNSSNVNNVMASVGAFSTVLNNGTNSNAFNDGMIGRFAVSGTLMNRTWSTFWGSAADDYLTSTSVDNNNVNGSGGNAIPGSGKKILVAGTTEGVVGTDFPAAPGSYGIALAAPYNANAGSYDAIYSRVAANGATVELTGFYGGTGSDGALGAILDNQRNPILAGASGGSATPNIATSGTQTTNSNTAQNDGFVLKMCDLVVPNTAQLSTDNGGSWAATQACVTLNSASPGTGSLIHSGSTGTAATAIADGRSTFTVRIDNAVQGVTYRVFVADDGWYAANNLGTTASTTDPASVGAAADRQVLMTLVADGDGTMLFPITGSTLSTAITTLNGGTLAANTPFDLFVVASTPTSAGIPAPCNQNGAVLDINIAPQPIDNRITETAPVAYGAAGTETPGSNRNFYGCYGVANSFAVDNAGGHAANSFSWAITRVPGSSRTLTAVAANPTTLGVVSGTGTNTVTLNPTFNTGFAPSNNTSSRDTLVLRVRETNANGCSNEYSALLFINPLDQVTNGVDNETPTTGATGTNPTMNNPTAVCNTSTNIPYRESGPTGDPYAGGGTVPVTANTSTITSAQNVNNTGGNITIHAAPTVPSIPSFAGAPNNTTSPGTFTPTYAWTVASVWTTASGAVADGTLAAGNFTLSGAATNALTVTGISAQPTSNPAFANFTLTETDGGIASINCVRQAVSLQGGGTPNTVSYQTRIFPTPTAVVLGHTDGGTLCEGATHATPGAPWPSAGANQTVYRVTVTPSTVTSGTFSVTLNNANLNQATIAAVTNASGGTLGGSTYSGNFSSDVFYITVNRGFVTAAYDAQSNAAPNPNNLSLTLNTLTNDAATTAGITCGLVSPTTSGTTIINQMPDTVSVRTGSYAAGTTPANPTEAHTTPAPASLQPVTSQPTNNITTSVTACEYQAVTGYGQTYWYALPEAGTATGPNANDWFDWTVTGGTQVTADGAGVRAIQVQWTAGSSRSVAVTQQSNQLPTLPIAGGGAGPFTNSCNTTQTTLSNITVNSIPATPTFTWNNAGTTADDFACEGSNMTLNITGGPAFGQVQIYAGTLGAATNVASVSAPSFPLAAPLAVVGLSGTGTGTYTIVAPTITPTVATSFASQTLNYTMVVMDNQAATGGTPPGTNCGRIGVVTPNITVFDQLPQVVLTPNQVDNGGTVIAGINPNNVCPNAVAPGIPAANTITYPAAPPAAYTYRVSNAFTAFPNNTPPNPGTTFTWALTNVGGGTTYTAGTDYTITLSSSGSVAGWTNDVATVTLGAHLTGVEWHVRAALTGDGCQSPNGNSESVNVIDEPHPNISSTPAVPGPYCSGSPITFVTPTVGAHTYQWAVYNYTQPSGTIPTDGSTALTNLGANTITGLGTGLVQTVTGANTASYTVTFTPFSSPANKSFKIAVVQTDNVTLCQQADTQFVMIRPVPDATVSQVLPTTGPCVFNNENSHIVAYTVPKSQFYTIASVAWTIPTGGAIYGYTTTNNANLPWFPTPGTGGVQAGANDTMRAQWYLTGARTVTATVTTTDGCVAGPYTFNTFVYPVPSPVISGPASICKYKTGGTSPQATYNVNPNVAGDTYTWEIIPSTGGSFVGASNGVGIVSVGINWDGPANTVYTLRCTQVSTQGCTNRTTFDVTVNPNPAPAISPAGPVTMCTNQPYVFSTQNNTGSGYAWTITGGTATASITSGGNTASATVVATAAGTVNLQVIETVSATTCFNSATKTDITAITAPAPVITRATGTPLGAACVGAANAVTYQTPFTTGRTYTWAVSGGGNITATTNGPTFSTATVTWNTVGAQSISVTETAGQCSTMTTQAVNVSAVPTPVISGPTAPCSGNQNVHTYSTPNNIGSTYVWTFGSGVTPSGPTTNSSVNVTFSNNSAPTVVRTINVVETNSANCSNTPATTLNVTVISTPVLDATQATAITVAPTAPCQNGPTQTITLTATSILPSGTTLNWVVTGGTITTGQGTTSIGVNWNTSGTQTMTLTASNVQAGGTCTAVQAYTMVVNPAPTAFNVVPSTASTCVNSAYQVSLNGSQTGVNYQLMENSSPLGAAVAGTGSAINFPSITRGTANTYSYTVVATFAAAPNCTATMTGAAVVTVNPLPTPAITQTPNPVCAGSNVVFSTPAAAGRTYVWTVPSGYTITSGSGTASITCATTSTTTAGTITVAETITATGCSATANFTSVVTPATVVQNVTPATAQVCRPNTGTTTFNVQLTGSQSGVSYQVMNGASPVGGAVSGTGAALTLPVTIGTGGNIVNTGTYTLTVNATGTAPCNTPVAMNGSVALTVNPTPTPAVSGNATVCTGSTQTYSTTNNAGSTYAWTVPSGWTVTAGAGTSSITVTVGTTTGAQTISVLETVSATTCNATATFNVTVNATPAPTITGSTTVCGGSTTTYTTASGAGSYAWTVTGAGGNITSGEGTNAITVQWGTGAGTSTVAVAVTTNGCTGNASSTITVVARPVVNNVSTTAPNICATTPTTAATITVSGSQVGVNYVLYRNGGVVGAAVPGTGNPLTMTDNTHSGTAPYVLNYTVKAISTAAPCNTSSDTVVMNGTATITVNPLPNVTISGNTTVCQGSSQVYSVPSAGNQTYNWTVPTGWTVTAGAGTSAITATVGATGGNVSVTVTNTLTSCSNSNSVAVTVTSLPTAFNVTPAGNNAICLTNAAGTNNTYQIGLSGSQTGTNYQLFNGTNAVGAAVAGTGAALSPATWLITTTSTGTFTYTIQATSTACSGLPVTMTGSSIWTVNPNPAPAITGSNNVCASSTITYSTPANTGSNYSWTITGGTPTTATTSSVTVTWGTGASGTVAVTETISATGCARTTPTMNVTINALPTPTITGNATVCVGTTQTYSTGTFATYNWTVPTGGNITSGAGTNSIQVAWTAAGSQNVNLTVTNAANCSASTTLPVTVNAQPAAFNVTPATQTICNATPVAQINLSGSQTGVTYELRENGVATVPATTLTGTGAGLTFSRTVPAALRATLPANISYTVVATGTGGCTNNMTGSALVTVIANPTPTVTGPAAVCIGSTGTYTVTPVNAGSTYQWNAGGNTVVSQTANQATIAFNTTTGSPFTISVIETNSGCTGTASTTTTVNALPVAQTMTVTPASATICAAGGSAGTNTATLGLSATQSGFTYNLRRIGNTNIISTITGNGAAMTFPVISGLAAGSYGYTVEAISNTTPACTTAAMSNNITLTVVANPTPAITGPNSPCQNATVTYQTTNVTGNTYAWAITSGAGTFVGPTNTYQANVQWTATGAGTIQVTESNSVPCSQVNSYNVTVVTAPTPTISASIASPVCGGATVTYTTPSISGATYNWVLGSGGTISSGQGSNSIVVNWANATPDVAYASTVQVTVNNGGCTGSATSNITVNPKANPSLTGDAARCHGQSGTYTTPFVVNGRSYTWTLVNAPTGSVFAANNGTTFTGLNANSVVVNWANTGTAPVNATVQVVETPAVGSCTGTSTFNVTVNPLPVVTISGPAQVCQNTTVAYNATPAQTGLSYAWNVTGATTWSGQGTGTINVTWGTANGVISLTATNNGTSCTNTATNNNFAVAVTLNPQPAIATPPGTTACAGSTLTYSVQNPQVGLTYTWSNTGATSATVLGGGTQYQVTWTNLPGNGSITLTAATSGGVTCTGSVTRNITIAPNPTPSITGATAVCPNVDQTYSTPFQSGDTYQWTLPAGTFQVTGGSLTGNTVTVRWNQVATPTVRAVTVLETTQNGCTGTASVNVTVNPAPTPNISGNTNVCAYIGAYDGITTNNTQTYTVTNPVNAGSSFQWSIVPSSAGVFTGASSGVGVTTVTIQWNEPTTASTITNVLRVVETANGVPTCSGQTDLNVTVNWNPKPVISGARVWCDNTPYVANSTNAAQSGFATYSVTVPTTPPLTGGQVRNYVWTVTPSTAGSVVSGQGTNQVQVTWLNATNSPANAVLSVTETITYPGTGLTPATQFCPQTDTFRVTINPIPKPVISPATVDNCGRYGVTYSTTNVGGNTYAWTVNNGVIVGTATANSVNVIWNDVATDDQAGFVQITETISATGCTTTIRQNTLIDHTPVPVIQGPSTLCQQTTNGTNIGVYQAVNADGGLHTQRSYAWSIVSPTTGPVTLTGVASNNLGVNDRYTVTVNGNTNVPVTAVIRLITTSTTSTIGCNDDTTFTITINPNPTPVITSNTGGLNTNGVCAGSSHTYQTALVTGNNYSWTVAGGTIVGTNNTNVINVTWGPAGPGSVSVRETVGATGCYTDVTANVTIRPLPIPDLTNQTGGFNRPQVCAQSTTNYRTTDNTANGNTYAWAVTGGTIASGQGTPQIAVTWGAAGAGTVKVTETTPASQGSCSDSRTLNVTINPLPTPVISGPPAPPVCINSVQTYSTPNVAGNTYLWSVTGGVIQGANSNNTVSVRWNVAGNGTISVLETITATGCQQTATRTIVVNPLPVVTITPSGRTDLCTGQSVTLTATAGFVSYTWNTGETTPSITVSQAGTYSVTVTDGNGCVGTSTTITVTVQNRAKPVIQASGPTVICEGQSVTLTATQATWATAYRWSTGATTPQITVTKSGFYSVEASDGTCKATSDEVEVRVSPAPTVSITSNVPTNTICEGGSLTLDAGVHAEYDWKRNGTSVGSNRTITITQVAQAGSYTVTVKNSAGCPATSTPVVVKVNPNPSPVIDDGGKKQFCAGDSTTLDAGPGFSSYLWSNSGATTRRITVKSGGTYTVQVTDTNGCNGQSQPLTVTVFPTPPKPTLTRTGNTLTSSVAQSYVWYRNGSVISGSTGQSVDATSIGDGYYKVTITDVNGCINTSDSIQVIRVGVEDPIADAFGLKFSPNPTNGNVTMQLNLAQDQPNAVVTVRNLIGSEVMSINLDNITTGETNKALDLTSLPNGTYYVEVRLANGVRMTGRITKVD